MKKLFIIANWKSNKTIKETEEWLHSFSDGVKRKGVNVEGKTVIVAPSFTSLEHAHYCLGNLKLSLKFAAQDISPFDEGAHTGEVNGRQIKELADYVIVGHSERRKNFGEDEEMVNKKIEQSLKQELTPIVCVSNIDQVQSFLRSRISLRETKLKIIIAYEPLFAIGSGQADTPENANSMAEKIREELGLMTVLYGGSVTSKNIKGFTQMPNIDGALVGGASLDAQEFYAIIQNA